MEQLRQLRERRWDDVDLPGALHRWAAFWSASRHQRRGRGWRRNQACARHRSRRNRECSGGEAVVQPPTRAGIADRPQIPVRHRWGERVCGLLSKKCLVRNQPVQRCRNHKMRNVLDELPKEQQPQALNLMRAAWRVSDADEGVKRLEQLARFLEQEHESAARSLREGMREMFTVQRLQLPPSLYKCLGTTNVIESPQSGVQKRTHNVTRWRTGDMVQRWVASAWLLTEKHFRKVIGHRDLWALAVVLGRERHSNASSEKVA